MQVLRYVTAGLILFFSAGCGESVVTGTLALEKTENASATVSTVPTEKAGGTKSSVKKEGVFKLDLPPASADSWEERMKALDGAVSRARTLTKTGKEREARDIVREVLMEDPGHPDAMDMAQEIGLMEKESDNKLDAIKALIEGGQVSLSVLRLHDLREDASLAAPAKKMRLELATHEVFNTAKDPKEPWLNLRRGPSARTDILAQMSDGTKVRVLESTAKFWLVIVVDGGGLGRVGYAHRRWMRPFTRVE